MILVDKNIRNIEEKMPSFIQNFDEDSLTNIGYDLNTKCFYEDGNNEIYNITLEPGHSVFVSSKELITIPTMYCGKLALRNSKIRDGLLLTAPIYQPGHKTYIYYRLTNVTEGNITLSSEEKYVTIIFEELKDMPEKLYDGMFKDEVCFTGANKHTNPLKKAKNAIIFAIDIILACIFLYIITKNNINPASTIGCIGILMLARIGVHDLM